MSNFWDRIRSIGSFIRRRITPRGRNNNRGNGRLQPNQVLEAYVVQDHAGPANGNDNVERDINSGNSSTSPLGETGSLRRSFRGCLITEESTSQLPENREIQQGSSQEPTGQDQLDSSSDADAISLTGNNFQDNISQSTATLGGEDSNNNSDDLPTDNELVRGSSERRSTQGKPITQESARNTIRGERRIDRVL